MTGLSFDELHLLNADLADLRTTSAEADLTGRATTVVQTYLSRPLQVEARSDPRSESEWADDSLRFIAFFASERDDFSKQTLRRLIHSARGDRLALEAIEPRLVELLRSEDTDLSSDLRSFVADRLAGDINPRSKTRRSAPGRRWRDVQASFSVWFLQGHLRYSENKACKVVATAANNVGIAWDPPTRTDARTGQPLPGITVTETHIRKAASRTKDKYRHLADRIMSV